MSPSQNAAEAAALEIEAEWDLDNGARESQVPHIAAIIERHFAELRQAADGLEDAAQAVIARWDTPLWKAAEPTAAFIARLHSAKEAYARTKEQTTEETKS